MEKESLSTKPTAASQQLTASRITWQSPSNIALIKYWGKHGIQQPRNPSISFTLSECHTETSIEWEKGSGKAELIFNSEKNLKFQTRAEDYLKSIRSYLPFLGSIDLHIESFNNFPHSAGIASSASAMSSLALCLTSLEQIMSGTDLSKDEFLQKASFLARLGSGSASRSIFGGYVIWGKTDSCPGSFDDHACPLCVEVHDKFSDMHDCILIVDDGVKSVSSREGHALMDTHPYARQRYTQAHKNAATLIAAMQEGDEETFISIVEQEALGLHGLMMSSDPAYILLKPNTLHIIDKIRAFRKYTNIPVCFTLDAGPNVHILYPARETSSVQEFIKNELLVYCRDNRRIDDRIGVGPQKIMNGE